MSRLGKDTRLSRKDFLRAIAGGAAGSVAAAAASGRPGAVEVQAAAQTVPNTRKKTKAELQGTTAAVVKRSEERRVGKECRL